MGDDWKWVRGHCVFMEFAQSDALCSAHFESRPVVMAHAFRSAGVFLLLCDL